MKIRKLVSLILVALMLVSLCSCGTDAESASDNESVSETRIFTDSTGRAVEVPSDITAVAITGPLAQMYVFALCPDKLVGTSGEWESEAQEYIGEEYLQLPVLGQLYGGKGELNLETLLSSGAQIVIDVGEPKDSIVEDMDALQEQTGLPFVHITATLETTADAFMMLGDLLNCQEAAQILADYCSTALARTQSLCASVEKANILYITGENGLNVIAQGSYHGEIIDLLANNLAVVDEPSSKGTGNEVDMEQLLNWNPDVILFSPDSVYDSVAEDSLWSSMKAITEGTYYEVPCGPYNWMGFPPSVQRYLGMMWMENLLYPDAVTYNLQEEVTEYFRLFYHCDLSQAQNDAFFVNSLAKVS